LAKFDLENKEVIAKLEEELDQMQSKALTILGNYEG
jgi:uncharacterized protein Yka (UPF0111/DUF47 family)